MGSASRGSASRGRARKRLPAPVYDALLAGSERGQMIDENERAFTELQLAPHVDGQPAERSLSTSVMGVPINLPVLISPTGAKVAGAKD
jgi:pre-mycofactocin synthase